MVSVYDFIRSAALVIGVGFTAQQDRKTWMWGDSILWCAYSLGLFLFPGYLFPGHDSAMSHYLIRVMASLIFGMEARTYLSRNTRDESVIGSVLWARLLSSIFMGVVYLYGYMKLSSKYAFGDKTMYFDIEAIALLLLTSVYHFWQGEYKVGGREQRGHVSTVLRIIFLIAIFTGLLQLAFPTWVIPSDKKLDPLDQLVMRLCGALFLGNSFTALSATSFRYDEDRSYYLQSTIMTCAMMFLGLNIAYFVDGLFVPKEALLMHIGCIPIFIMMLGLYLIWRQSNGGQTDYFLRSKSM